MIVRPSGGWIKEGALAKRGSPRLSVLLSLDLAPLHALFVSMATKQCHAHGLPPHNPHAAPSSERILTRSPVGRAGPNLGAQSLYLSQAWGTRSGPQPPPIRNIPDTSAGPAPALPGKSSSCSFGNDLDSQGPQCSSFPLSGLLLPVQWALAAMGCADAPEQQQILGSTR